MSLMSVSTCIHRICQQPEVLHNLLYVQWLTPTYNRWIAKLAGNVKNRVMLAYVGRGA